MKEFGFSEVTGKKFVTLLKMIFLTDFLHDFCLEFNEMFSTFFQMPRTVIFQNTCQWLLVESLSMNKYIFEVKNRNIQSKCTMA